MATRLTTPPDIGQFAAEQGQRLLARLAMQISRTVRSGDADAVHDLRVAIRRFSQALAVLKPCFHAKVAKNIRRSLKKIMILAGAVRDCDVAMALLAKFEDEPVAEVLDDLRAKRKDAGRILVPALKRWIGKRTSSRWRAGLRDGGRSVGSTEDMATAVLPRMARRFFRRGKDAARAEASAEDLHQFRIAAKKLRYTLELFAPLYGAKAGRRLEQVTKVQTLLGASNDCQIARSIIRAHGGNERVERALRRKQRRKTGEFRRYWAGAFAGAATAARWIDELSRCGETTRRKPMDRSVRESRAADDEQRASA